MKQKKKLRMDDLKEELSKVADEISWHEEQISRSLDYAQTNKLKKEIQELKKQQILLLKDLESRVKNKTMLKKRGRLKSIGYRNGSGRTKML